MGQIETKKTIAQAILQMKSKPFRNRHIAEMTGLDRRLVDYHLKKWLNHGIIQRDPLNSVMFFVPNLEDFVNDVLATEETPSRIEHMPKDLAFNAKAVTTLSEYAVLLRAIDYPEWEKAIALVREHLDKVVRGIKQERYYLTYKKITPVSAVRQITREFKELCAAFDIDQQSLANHLGTHFGQDVQPEKQITPEEIEQKVRAEMEERLMYERRANEKKLREVEKAALEREMEILAPLGASPELDAVIEKLEEYQ